MYNALFEFLSFWKTPNVAHERPALFLFTGDEFLHRHRAERRIAACGDATEIGVAPVDKCALTRGAPAVNHVK